MSCKCHFSFFLNFILVVLSLRYKILWLKIIFSNVNCFHSIFHDIHLYLSFVVESALQLLINMYKLRSFEIGEYLKGQLIDGWLGMDLLP